MQKKIIASILSIMFLNVIGLIGATSTQQDALMKRMFGFQLPYDATANYTFGWIERWDAQGIENELRTIRSNFTNANLLRIAITWYEMNESILLDHIQDLLDLGREYNFKFLLYLMDRTGGSWPNLTPENYDESNWADHEARINNVLEAFKSDSQVYAWGLENEANVFQETQVKWFEHFIPYMKAIDTDTPICTSFYPLGLNSTTISRYQEIASFGLDFIEYHHYARDDENITQTVDWFTTYIKMPIFISEFSVYGGLSTYNTTANQRILRDQMQEWEKRPNVIGMSYYRFSNDTDPWTIWNQTSNSMKAEGNTLNTYGHAFLNTYPYAYLYNLGSTNTTRSIQIWDPSFQKLITWPNRNGWITSRNHTKFDLKNITSTNPTTGSLQSLSIANYYFQQDFTDWNYWPQVGPPGEFQWAIVNDPTNASGNVYYGQKALKLWANTTRHNDTQAIHTAMSVVPGHSYFLQAYVKVNYTALGGYAFISINFRDSGGAWIEWPESEYVNQTSNWTQVYVGGIAPLNSVDMVISLRTRAWDTPGQGVLAYFDLVSMQETIPATYDGRSYAMAWGRGTYDLYWNFAEVIQNYTFPNPAQDVQKLWTFKCKLATVISDEYWTDWKGCFITIAFTTSNPDEWISWHDSKYLSINHQFMELEVSGIPPANAKGLLMIVKVSIANYGVMFFDDARLYSQPLVVPLNFTVPTIASEGASYQFAMTVKALNRTQVQGFLYGGPFAIIDGNVNFTGESKFYFTMINATTMDLRFWMGTAPLDIWMPIMLLIGVCGLAMIIFAPFLVIRSIKKKHYDDLLWAFIIFMIGIGCVIAWLW